MTIAGSLKIGTLLMQADLIKEEDLADSVQVAKRTKLPLGRVLIGNGFITDDVLNAALAAQALIRDRILSHDIAIKALRAINERKIGFEAALKEFGLHSDHLEFTAKLGQLLLDSGMISPAQRNEALQTALAAGLPIGRVLVLKGSLSPHYIYAALTAQVMIRAEYIGRVQAIEALKEVKASNIHLEKALNNAGYFKPKVANKVMLGELLIISDQLVEVDFLTALETSLANDLPLGTVLIEAGLISQEKLDRTLDVQKQVTERKIGIDQAAEILQQEETDGYGKVWGAINPPASLNDIPVASLNNIQLLVLARVITSRHVDSAQAEATRTGQTLEQVLMARGMIDENILETTGRCLQLITMNTITVEEAILVLHAWLSKPDQAVDEVLAQIAQRDLS